MEGFAAQCPTLKPPFAGLVKVDLTVFYASRRPDLDESVVLDCMQGRIYANDRQVKIKFVYWALDKLNPRTMITVSELTEYPYK